MAFDLTVAARPDPQRRPIADDALVARMRPRPDAENRGLDAQADRTGVPAAAGRG